MLSPKLCKLVATASVFAVAWPAPAAQIDDYMRKTDELRRDLEVQWRRAGSPGESSPEGRAYVDAAISDFRPDLVEQVLAGGDMLKRQLSVPRGGERVPLHTLRAFAEFHAHLRDEMFASFSRQQGWLARRVTKDAVEVWTASHGWLFDGRGRLLNEAHPPRDTGYGREWYGAFLPDGQWVTTDLDEMDGQLHFYSATGKWLRTLSCEELAPPPDGAGSKLLGWGRSDANGNGWVVNIGSEAGWATIWVGPTGLARILQPGERWKLCYPRALGPRGTYTAMSVPDDAHRTMLYREEASHGSHVGFPRYVNDAAASIVPNGNYVFGFWPRRTSYFVGAEGYHENGDGGEASGLRTRKFQEDAYSHPMPIIDKTWFFDGNGKVTGWVRARRIGDAADGKGMLFRITADSRIVTLGPDLRVKSMRRFVWKNGSTADAVALWADLRLGLFIRDEHLVLASWP